MKIIKLDNKQAPAIVPITIFVVLRFLTGVVWFGLTLMAFVESCTVLNEISTMDTDSTLCCDSRYGFEVAPKASAIWCVRSSVEAS